MKRLLFSALLLLYRLTGYQFILACLMPIDGLRCGKLMGVKMGDHCRVYNCNFGTEPYLITIGNHVSIGSGVQFYTHDGGVWVLRPKLPLKNIDSIAPIRVGNNVYIGNRSIVLPGVNIGDNVVIGAGSVVTKDIPSNSVAAGVPARVVKSLESYKTKVTSAGLCTGDLAAKQKRQRLLNHFGS